MNKRQAEQMMRQMGMKSETIQATEVIIRTAHKEIIILQPEVMKVNMMGQDTFQIAGRITERAISVVPEMTEEDIQTVMDSAQVSRNEAALAISAAKGDLAQAILDLKKEQ